MTTILATKNRRSGVAALALVVGMVCLGYASVPLYRLFCQATGFAGTTRRATTAEAPGAVPGHTLSIRFDANHAPNLPWRFEPERTTERVTVGEREIAFFTATNLSNRVVTGTATFNVTPSQAGGYFTKIQCFCFTQQTLQPHETTRMPVIFYVDPRMLDDPDARDLAEITLSYTFYPVDPAKVAS